ncbi:MAG: hypothetical protein ACI9A7_002568 [Cyclobacteriaceae bacterium]|jgi:hypothetical protein
MSLEYNTEREHITLKEYGRNVQNLVQHIKNTDDKEKRDKYASVLVELMKSINPEFSKDANEYTQKVWDDLFIISKFDLDVKSPFAIPESTILDRKPDRVKYKLNRIRYKHYGKNVEQLIKDAIALEDPAEKEGAVVAIGKLMKTFFQTWNNEVIEDTQILKNIRQLSENQLDIEIEKVNEFSLFDSEKSTRSYDNNKTNNRRSNPSNNKGGAKKNYSNKRRKQN